MQARPICIPNPRPISLPFAQHSAHLERWMNITLLIFELWNQSLFEPRKEFAPEFFQESRLSCRKELSKAREHVDVMLKQAFAPVPRVSLSAPGR